VVLVLDLRFGQGRAAVDAPVHRLLALVHNPALDELAEGARDVRLVPELHGQVRLIPLTGDGEALELLRHDVDEALGVGAAGAADVGE
jgi:hypothetical protein